jgi:hypothetical protein
MSDFLLLGPVSFEGFELPGRIDFGGAQRMAVHQLPGGARVIDAMGRDDAPITWSGAFFGPEAADRARLLDLLRANGAPLSLAWDAFAYLVVIAQFAACYERPNWVPYRIACTVLTDQSATLAALATSLSADLADDLNTAAAGVDTSAALAALAGPGAATLGTAAYSRVVAAVGTAMNQGQAALDGAGTTLLVASDPVTAASAAGTLALVANAQGYLGRAAANLANTTS